MCLWDALGESLGVVGNSFIQRAWIFSVFHWEENVPTSWCSFVFKIYKTRNSIKSVTTPTILFLKYILLIMLLQSSQFFPHCPLCLIPPPSILPTQFMSMGHVCKFFGFFLPFKKKRLYLFIFRERGREGEREGEKYHCVVASSVPPVGDLVHNPGMYPDWE